MGVTQYAKLNHQPLPAVGCWNIQTLTAQHSKNVQTVAFINATFHGNLSQRPIIHYATRLRYEIRAPNLYRRKAS
jgi:hypothetical protein